MARRPILCGILALLGVVAGRLPLAAVRGQTPSENQPAASYETRLYQEVTVAQKSVCRVQGLESRLNLRYRVLSSLMVNERHQGALDVRQKIETAKLLQADEATQAVFSDLLQKLVGTSFAMGFDARRRLVRFEGAKDHLQAAAGPAVGPSLLMASLIDRDGWKEIARYSFFEPPRPLRPGAHWEDRMTHRWGSLGDWTGRIAYQYAGRQGELQRFTYTLKLAYVPPKAAARNLLLPISQARFKLGQAGGTIDFDPGKRRVRRIEERFAVQGQVAVEILGQSFPAELDEEQDFQVRLLEHAPQKPKGLPATKYYPGTKVDPY